jgi:streptogramin lyase
MDPVDFALSTTKDIKISETRQVSLETFELGKNVSSYGLAAAPDGSVYASLTSNGIAKIANGRLTKFERKIGKNPYSLLMVGDDEVWFTDLGGRRVGRMRGNGTFEEITDLRKLPAAELCLGPDERIWVAAKSHLVRLTRTGERDDLRHPSSTAIAVGLGNRVCTIDDHYIYVVDEEDEWVRGKLPVGLNPSAMVRAPDDSLWITDMEHHLICNARHVSEGIAYRFSEEITPFMVAVDEDNSLWLPSRNGRSFLHVRPREGTATEYVVQADDADLTHVVIAADGSLWFTEVLRDRLARYRR